MKDLIGKIATIAAPGLFEGERELKGFEYTESGQGIRWDGMAKSEFIPIGIISVVGNPVAEKKAGGSVSQQASDSELALKLRIAALEAQLAAGKTSGGESGKGSAEAPKAPVSTPSTPAASTPGNKETKTEEPKK